jgi:integrase
MSDLREFIKDKRPSLSDSSITTYNSILKNLYKKVFGTGEIHTAKFDETEPILKHLDGLPPNKRKTILSALVVVTDSKSYRDKMMEDIKDYNHEIAKQEKTETQRENWVDVSEIKALWDKLSKSASALYRKPHKTMTDLQEIQNFIILSLLGGCCGLPPRRLKDWCDFKIKHIDKTYNNYLDKNTLVFNSYKTAKCYGEQRIPLPAELKRLLTKWIKINPTDYLFFDNNTNSLTSVKLNQRCNKLFNGKKVSCNVFRHSYLTDKYADTIRMNKNIANTMSEMGSSTSMLKTYVKED